MKWHGAIRTQRTAHIPIYYVIHNCDVILKSVFVKFIASIKINHQENHARFSLRKVHLTFSIFLCERDQVMLLRASSFV